MRWLLALLFLVGCAYSAPSPLAYPEKAADVESMLRQEADRLDTKIQWGAWDRSITFRHVIYLNPRLTDRSRDRARVLAHELTHARQYKRHPGFIFRYALSARFRYKMEREAHEEELRAMRAMGFSEKSIAETEEDFLDDLGDVYLVR